MDQENQGINPDALALVPFKRKRGRPRKHPRADLNHGESAYTARNWNLYRAYNALSPNRIERVNGTKTRRHANSDIVGQPVYGVIEAAFDAGYLLTVKVGNSETTLRGVVLKPGHFVPVSPENDVAPNVQMIQRNEIGFTRKRKKPISSFPNGSAHPFRESSVASQVPQSAPLASNVGASRSKQVPVTTNNTAPSLTSRGNVVPVLLQPANIPTGGTAINQVSTVTSQPADLVTSKSKKVDVPLVANQTLPAQTPKSCQVVPKGTPTDVDPCNHTSAQMSHKVDANSAGMECKPFEKLLAEVMKGAESPSQKLGALSGGLSLTPKDSGCDMEDAHPISNQPLQAVEPENATSMFKPLENFRTGKMTELLKAVQENTCDNQAARSKKLVSYRAPEFVDKETKEFMEGPKASGV